MWARAEGSEASGVSDKLVVGHQAFVKAVAGRLATKDEHSCQEQDGVDYKAMARDLWDAGYRFDSEARIQWLVVELRSRLAGTAVSEMFGELLELLEVDT